MSIQTVTETRTIEVNSKVFVCDLCERRIAQDIFMRLLIGEGFTGPAEYTNESFHTFPKHLDICSLDCLHKNLGGLSVLLNTKLLADANDFFKKEKPETYKQQNIAVGVYSSSIAANTIINAKI